MNTDIQINDVGIGIPARNSENLETSILPTYEQSQIAAQDSNFLPTEIMQEEICLTSQPLPCTHLVSGSYNLCLPPPDMALDVYYLRSWPPSYKQSEKAVERSSTETSSIENYIRPSLPTYAESTFNDENSFLDLQTELVPEYASLGTLTPSRGLVLINEPNILIQAYGELESQSIGHEIFRKARGFNLTLSLMTFILTAFILIFGFVLQMVDITLSNIIIFVSSVQIVYMLLGITMQILSFRYFFLNTINAIYVVLANVFLIEHKFANTSIY